MWPSSQEHMEHRVYRWCPGPGGLWPQQCVWPQHQSHLYPRRLQSLQRQQVWPSRRPLQVWCGQEEMVRDFLLYPSFVMKYACLNATVAGFSHMYCSSDHNQHSYVCESKQLDRKYAVKLPPPEYKVGMMWMCGCVKIPGSSLEHLLLANGHDVSCLRARCTAKVF